MSNPTKILTEEHQNILKFIEILNEECDAIEKEGRIDYEFLKKAVDFIKNYADKFHHKKEEDVLFVELCKPNVMMHCNPVQQMLYEHDIGRKFVKGLENGLKKKSKKDILENARGYAELLREHIFKEDNILYPMAENALSKNIKQKIGERFKKINAKNKEEEKKYLEILRK